MIHNIQKNLFPGVRVCLKIVKIDTIRLPKFEIIFSMRDDGFYGNNYLGLSVGVHKLSRIPKKDVCIDVADHVNS